MKTKQGLVWAKDDLQYLREHYKTDTNEQMADVLGRTAKAVKVMLSRTGLCRPEPPLKPKVPYHDNEKKIAKDHIKQALRKGLIKKLPCLICGSTPVEGHHEDYSKPLDVIWLCCKHHNMRHVLERRGFSFDESIVLMLELYQTESCS